MNSNAMNSTIFERATVPQTHPASLFPQISRCKSIKQLNQIHAQFTKTGLILDPLVAAEILKFLSLSNHRDLNYARKFFTRMPVPNCFSWNTIIRAFAESDENDSNPLEALLLFNQMCIDSIVEPNRFTFPSVLKACAKIGKVEEGKQIHGYVIKLGLDSDEFVLSNLVRMYSICDFMEDAHKLFRGHQHESSNVVLHNVMIDGYARLGDIISARQVFNEMPQRSVVSWNAMISRYAQNGFFKEAVELFRAMLTSKESPNYVTLVSILPVISRLGSLELGKWVHLYAKKNKIEIDDILGSALIDMYSKCGSIEKAIQVFESIHNKNDPITWNSMMGGLAMHGRANDALDYYERMQKANVKPTDVTYIALLNACSHSGLVEKGRSLFNYMVNVLGIEPRIEHYGCMVDLLGRAGLLEEAEQLIQNMPIKPDDVIWKSLLGACKTHQNIEIGKRVANILMEFLPEDSGSYVALSNMLASRGDWDGVSKVRLKMKEMDVRKDPGCSWIDIDGAIHEFLVEDESHPRANEIRSMLEEISGRLGVLGYEPKRTQVLLNMGEEEKGSVLHYHSERIAIAFGLISTRPRSPLMIVKNLRVCEDCHSVIKLIAQIYDRKIVVRDRKKFHHFENGVCSCMDYW